MKKNTLIIGLFTAFALSSCYEDKSTLPENPIDGVELNVTEEEKVIRIGYKEQLDIVPNITKNGKVDDSGLTYEWAVNIYPGWSKYEYEVIGKSGLAFDHDEIIIKGIMDLRYKVDSTDIVFNLMPEEFTIGQLKQVYSLLLGRELVNSAFRRVIAPKIVETGKMISTGGHRPSQLCRYNEEQQ